MLLKCSMIATWLVIDYACLADLRNVARVHHLLPVLQACSQA